MAPVEHEALRAEPFKWSPVPVNGHREGDDMSYGEHARIGIRHPVRVCATANLTLSGTQTVDGVALVEGDFCLCPYQTDKAENGAYQVEATAWVRRPDFGQYQDVAAGHGVYVQEGDTFAKSTWRIETAGVLVIGTTEVDWGFETLRLGISAEDQLTGSVTTELPYTNKVTIPANTLKDGDRLFVQGLDLVDDDNGGGSINCRAYLRVDDGTNDHLVCQTGNDDVAVGTMGYLTAHGHVDGDELHMVGAGTNSGNAGSGEAVGDGTLDRTAAIEVRLSRQWATGHADHLTTIKDLFVEIRRGA